MRFVLYTTKSIGQCMTDLTERVHAEKPRTPLDGWMEKSGNFSLATTIRISRRFQRTTRMYGTMERLGDLTIIRGSVSEGVQPSTMRWLLLAMLVVGVLVAISGQPLTALVCGGFMLAVTIPLMGDHQNSATLLKELKRTLDAKDRQPTT